MFIDDNINYNKYFSIIKNVDNIRFNNTIGLFQDINSLFFIYENNDGNLKSIPIEKHKTRSKKKYKKSNRKTKVKRI